MEAKTTSAGDSRPATYTHTGGLGTALISALRHLQTMYTVSAQSVFATTIAATVCQNAKLLMGASWAQDTPPMRHSQCGHKNPAFVRFPFPCFKIANFGAAQAKSSTKVDLVIRPLSMFWVGDGDHSVKRLSSRTYLGRVVGRFRDTFYSLDNGRSRIFVYGFAKSMVEMAPLFFRKGISCFIRNLPALELSQSLLGWFLPHAGSGHAGASFKAGFPSARPIPAIGHVDEVFTAIRCDKIALQPKRLHLRKTLINKVYGPAIFGFCVFPPLASAAHKPSPMAGAFPNVKYRSVACATVFVNVKMAMLRLFRHSEDYKHQLAGAQ